MKVTSHIAKTVVLELTMDEAQMLQDCLSRDLNASPGMGTQVRTFLTNVENHLAMELE